MFTGGNPWGGLVGAAIVGFAGSYGASIGVYDDSDGEDIYYNISVYSDSYVLNNPNENPYDESVGKRHNYLLKEGTIENPIGGPLNEYDLFESMSLSSNENDFLSDKMDETISIYNDMKNAESISSIKSVVSSNIDDSLLIVTMNSYLDGLSGLTDPGDAIALAQDYEHYIMNNDAYTSSQKDCLLQGLAVAKYSCYFWSSVMD